MNDGLDFYGGAPGDVADSGDILDQMGVTTPVLDLSGSGGDMRRGNGPAFAWVGCLLLLVGLRVLTEVYEDVS